MTVAMWYVASLADGQTHRADQAGDVLVTALCDGRQFRPLVALTGTPPDQAQICPACRAIPLRPGQVTAPPTR